MSQAPHSNVTPPADRPSDVNTASRDPLARLHKMSTTAGVTNLDYVAVNQTAIAAVLLGLLSALSFFGYLLLVIPVVGVVFAVIALRQIGDSNGTQTGRGLAVLGLALSVLLGGGALGKEALAVARVKGDESRIAAAISQTGALIRDHKYKEAYDLFDPEFQRRVPLTEFQGRWQAIQNAALGDMVEFEWNNVTPAFDSAEGHRLAVTKVRAKFTKGVDDRFDIVLKESDGKWQIVRFEAFFPASPPPGAGGPPRPKNNDVFNF